MRRCTAPSSAAAERSSASSSLTGLPWHEFVRRVAAAEADAERAQSSVHIVETNSSGRAGDPTDGRHRWTLADR